MKRLAVICISAALAALLCLSAAAAQPVLRTDTHVRYIQGSGEGFFRPNDTLTRAETAVMLSRLLAEPGAPGETAFTDLAPGTWYTAGCVSVEESVMVQLLRRVGPGARILIAENAASLGRN